MYMKHLQHQHTYNDHLVVVVHCPRLLQPQWTHAYDRPSLTTVQQWLKQSVAGLQGDGYSVIVIHLHHAHRYIIHLTAAKKQA